MKNEEIIMSNRVFLMEQGVLEPMEGDTMITVSDENGTRSVPLPEEIHTFQGWKAKGYVVNKGEHAIAKFPIWKHVENKDNDNGIMFMKVSFFFKASQVKKLV